MLVDSMAVPNRHLKLLQGDIYSGVLIVVRNDAEAANQRAKSSRRQKPVAPADPLPSGNVRSGKDVAGRTFAGT